MADEQQPAVADEPPIAEAQIGHTFGTTHGAGDATLVGAEPDSPLDAT